MDGRTKQQNFFTVELHKKHSGYGLNLTDGPDFHGVYIKQIKRDSSADHDGCIKKGDRLVAINGINVENATKRKCTEMLKLSQNIAVLHLERFVNGDLPPLDTVQTIVELDKGASGFGVRLMSDLETGGIFVNELMAGGAAEKDGRILIGDRVIEINRFPLDGFAHQQPVELLKNCSTATFVLERYNKPQSKSVRKASKTGSSSCPQDGISPTSSQQLMFPLYQDAAQSVPQEHLTHSIPSKKSAFKRFKQRQNKLTTNILHGTPASVQCYVNKINVSSRICSFIQQQNSPDITAALFSSQQTYGEKSSSNNVQPTGKSHDYQNVRKIHDQRCAGPLQDNAALVYTAKESVHRDGVSSTTNPVIAMPNTMVWIRNGRPEPQKTKKISITINPNDNYDRTANHQPTITNDIYLNRNQQMLDNQISTSDTVSTCHELSLSYPSECTDQVIVQSRSMPSSHRGEAMTIQSSTTNTAFEKYLDSNGAKSVGSYVEELPKKTGGLQWFSLNENGTSENVSTSETNDNSSTNRPAIDNYDVDFHKLEDNTVKFQPITSRTSTHENAITNMEIASGHIAPQTHSNLPVGEYVYEVTLFKRVNGLGMNLAGGGSSDTPVTIKKIVPGTAANDSAQLRVGDIILEVNGKPVSHLAAKEVILILRACTSKVQLLTKRPVINDTYQSNAQNTST